VLILHSLTCITRTCSALTSVTSALEVINVMRSINPRFTYFTYLLTNVDSVCRSDYCTTVVWGINSLFFSEHFIFCFDSYFDT